MKQPNYPASCSNKVEADDWLFIRHGSDLAYAAGVREWAAERVRRGTNKPSDQGIVDELILARSVETEQRR